MDIGSSFVVVWKYARKFLIINFDKMTKQFRGSRHHLVGLRMESNFASPILRPNLLVWGLVLADLRFL